MTSITKRKPGKSGWLSLATYRGRGGDRQIAVALTPHNFLLRLKGTRQELSLPISAAYQIAADYEARRIMKTRKEAREAAKKEQRKVNEFGRINRRRKASV